MTASGGKRKLLSDSLFRALIDGADDLIAIMDVCGKALYSNRETAELHKGGSIAEYFDESDFTRNAAEIIRSVADGSSWEGEASKKDAEGATRWHSIRLFPFNDEKDETIYVGGIFRDITREKESGLNCESHLSFEKVISDISKRFISPFELDQAINDSLRQLGEAVKVDRAYLYEIDDFECSVANTHEWVADGIASTIDLFPRLPFEAVSWFIEKIKNGETVKIEDANELPDGIAEKKAMTARKIISDIVVPVPAGKYFSGFLGLDSVRAKRGFTNEDEKTLVTAAKIISRGIEQKRGEEVRKNLENHLIEAKKIEAIGQLAGGVAHDFNNLLAVVMAAVSVMKMESSDKALAASCVDDIMNASVKMRELTKSLLAYSRHEVIRRERVNLAELARETGRLVKRALPKGVKYVESIDDGEYFVFADPGRIMHVLLDLCFNARDAIGSDGVISLSLEKETFAESPVIAVKGVAPGEYCSISVKDTGQGMSGSVKEKIFDPFFTTKPPGKGTGLGLSNAYGVVKNHNGAITVESDPGRGAVFTVLLPSV